MVSSLSLCLSKGYFICSHSLKLFSLDIRILHWRLFSFSKMKLSLHHPLVSVVAAGGSAATKPLLLRESVFFSLNSLWCLQCSSLALHHVWGCISSPYLTWDVLGFLRPWSGILNQSSALWVDWGGQVLQAMAFDPMLGHTLEWPSQLSYWWGRHLMPRFWC